MEYRLSNLVKRCKCYHAANLKVLAWKRKPFGSIYSLSKKKIKYSRQNLTKNKYFMPKNTFSSSFLLWRDKIYQQLWKTWFMIVIYLFINSC